MTSYSNSPMERFFPKSVDYSFRNEPTGEEVRESEPVRASIPYSERHLQCVWFDPALRPAKLASSQGENVYVADPGRWNLESGPDFRDAVIEVGPDKRRICGDAEVHIRPSDWISHKHSKDQRYDNVRIHITYFNEPLPAEQLPPGTIQISLKKRLLSNPYFAFENIDLTAYPFNAKRGVSPCAKIMKEWSRDEKEALLEAAGQERLLRKSELLLNSMRSNGEEQALYTWVMRALGFKNNKAPFKFLAESLPASVLREESQGDPIQAYALLMGLSRLLPETLEPNWDEETVRFVRDLWDRWWRLKERWGGLAMDKAVWCRAGQRPHNSPERRLMAAASLFAFPEPLSSRWQALSESTPNECVKTVMRQLMDIEGGYWDHRLSWSGQRQTKRAKIVGRARAAAIAANVFVPFLAAKATEAPFASNLIGQLPAESLNNIMRQTAYSLFGPIHPPALYNSAIRRQGLMQIFQDYCLNDRSGCRECPFTLPRERMDAM